MTQDPARERVRYSWIKRLQEAGSDSEVLKKEAAIIEEQQQNLPQDIGTLGGIGITSFAIKPGTMPDLSELLSKPVAEWAEKFNGLIPDGPSDQSPPLRTLESAITHNPEWAISLAEAMLTPAPKDTPAWPSIITGLCQADLTQDQQTSVLDIMGNSIIQAKCGDSIAGHLYDIVKYGGKPFAPDVIEKAETVASSLWDRIQCNTEPTANESWFHHATSGCGVGYLPLFWSSAAGIRMRNQGIDRLTDACRNSLTAMLTEKTTKGLLAQSAIGTQTAFLLKADEQWTAANILPIFDSSDDPRALPSWEGFLRAQKVDDITSQYLGEVMHNRLNTIYQMLPTPEDRRNLAKCYSALLCYYAPDPGSWLKETVLSNGQMAALTEREIHRKLGRSDSVQQQDWWHRWISNYWNDRRSGTPEPFSNEEALLMWGWAAEMPAVYPEAARMAASTPLEQAHWTDIQPLLETLSELPAAKEHPWETAELLSVLLPKTDPDFQQAARRMAEPLYQAILEQTKETVSDQHQGILDQVALWMGSNSQPIE